MVVYAVPHVEKQSFSYVTTQHMKGWSKYTTDALKLEKLISKYNIKCKHVKLSWIHMILVIKFIAFHVNE